MTKKSTSDTALYRFLYQILNKPFVHCTFSRVFVDSVWFSGHTGKIHIFVLPQYAEHLTQAIWSSKYLTDLLGTGSSVPRGLVWETLL